MKYHVTKHTVAYVTVLANQYTVLAYSPYYNTWLMSTPMQSRYIACQARDNYKKYWDTKNQKYKNQL
jgi:hypothetical protein